MTNQRRPAKKRNQPALPVEARGSEPLNAGDGKPVSATDSAGPRILGDDPVRTRAEDRLGRTRFASAIARTIIRRTDHSGLVIGLYGAWGEGKTSVLHMVDEGLGSSPMFETLWFNPWYFRSEEQLVEAFFQTLAATLQVRLGTTGDQLHDALTKYGSMLAVVPTELLGIPNPGKAVKEAAKLFSKNTLDDLKAQIEAALDVSGVRIVVFIDDVDRLDSSEIHAVLKLVKLTGGFRNLIYVLAFDDQAVARAVSVRYGNSYEAGRDFLEKIVQLPLRLPPADRRAVLSLALAGVDRALDDSAITLSEEEVNAYRRYFDPVFEATPRTLRTAKRYGNSLSFVFPLLKGEVNGTDLMLLESLRVLYPDVYGAISINRDLFTGASMRGYRAQDRRPLERKRLDDIISNLPAVAARTVMELLEYLFPPLQALTRNNVYGADWESGWTRDKRVVAEDYFDRYFQYAIAHSDVSDVEVDRFLSDMAKIDVEQAAVPFDRLLTPESAERIVSKLRARIPVIDPNAAKMLVPLLALSGGKLPGENSFISFTSPFGQGAHLIKALVRRLPDTERERAALDAAHIAQPLAFALALWQAIRRPEGANTDRVTLSEDGENRLEDVIRERLRRESVTQPFYLRPKGQAARLLSAWEFLCGKNETEPRLLKDFETNLNWPGLFVASIVPTAVDMSTGLPFESELERDHYDLIGRLIDHEKLLPYLKKAFGDRLGPPSSYPTPDAVSDPALRAAQGYAYLHKIVTAIGPSGSAASESQTLGLVDERIAETPPPSGGA
jgi:hypothetical protein